MDGDGDGEGDRSGCLGCLGQEQVAGLWRIADRGSQIVAKSGPEAGGRRPETEAAAQRQKAKSKVEGSDEKLVQAKTGPCCGCSPASASTN